MSVERPDFVATYNAITVPTTLLSMDAIDEVVHETSEAFFKEVSDSLDLSYRSLLYFFERDIKMLVPTYGEDVRPENRVHSSDDYFEYFRKKGGQVLAAVMYTRDDFNFQFAQYALYPLHQNTIDDVRTLHRMEQIEADLE